MLRSGWFPTLGVLVFACLMVVDISCIPPTPTLLCRRCPCSPGYTCIKTRCVPENQRVQASRNIVAFCGERAPTEFATDAPIAPDEPVVPDEPAHIDEPLTDNAPHDANDATDNPPGTDGGPWELNGDTTPVEPKPGGDEPAVNPDHTERVPEHIPEPPCPAPPLCPKQKGPCKGSAPQNPTCVGGQWRCTDADYKLFLAQYATDDTTCDGIDNDCSGVIDQDATNCATTAIGPRHTSEDGPAMKARFWQPRGLLHHKGEWFVMDRFNHAIRKLDAKGVVSTFVDFRQLTRCPNRPILLKPAEPANGAIDAKGNLYVTDPINHLVWKVTSSGNASCFAGSQLGSKDGTYHASQFSSPRSVVVTPDGNTLYLADTENHVIRKLEQNTVTTVAGGNNVRGFKDGVGKTARFSSPKGLYLDAKGVLYIADSENHIIRKLDQNSVTTIAGTVPTNQTFPGFADGPALQAKFSLPQDITSDGQGTLYVADATFGHIRRIQQSQVSTLSSKTSRTPGCEPNASARTDAYLYQGIQAITFVNNALYFASSYCNRVFKSDLTATPRVNVLSGDGPPGHREGTGQQALLSRATGIALADNGNTMYIADKNNYRLRKATRNPDHSWQVSTLAGTDIRGNNDGTGSNATFFDIYTIALDAPNDRLLIAELSCIRQIKLSTKQVTTLVGNCKKSGYQEASQGQPQVLFNAITSIVLNKARDTLFIADSRNHMIRALNLQTFDVTRVAGSLQNGKPISGHSPDMTSALQAKLNTPSNVAFDKMGRLLFTDTKNNRVKYLDANGRVSTLFGPIATLATPQPGLTLRVSAPLALAMDAQGDALYWSNDNGNRIVAYQLSTKKHVILSASIGPLGNGPLNQTTFLGITNMAFDAAKKRLYTASNRSHRIRRIQLK